MWSRIDELKESYASLRQWSVNRKIIFFKISNNQIVELKSDSSTDLLNHLLRIQYIVLKFIVRNYSPRKRRMNHLQVCSLQKSIFFMPQLHFLFNCTLIQKNLGSKVLWMYFDNKFIFIKIKNFLIYKLVKFL